MVTRDRETQQRQEARQRHEHARQRLSAELGDRVQALAEVSPRELMVPEDNYTHRAALIESGLQLITPLRRFIGQELEQWVDPALLERGVFEVDDIVAATYIAAVDQAESAPVARAFYTWLRRTARRQIRAAILEVAERDHHEKSLYTAVYDAGASDNDIEDWPDDVRQLIDILADPNAPLPEDILELQAMQGTMNPLLNKLPEQWREVFLMQAVDEWSPEEISILEGLDPKDIAWKVAMSREFLRSWLEQAQSGNGNV